jgi:AraC-like DNA-binding protein
MKSEFNSRSLTSPLKEQHAALIAEICRLIEKADAVPVLNELASLAGMSPFHFHRVFKEVTRLTPKRYARYDPIKVSRRRSQYRNPFCHRRMLSRFNSGGIPYRWGVERKRSVLEREAAVKES